MGMKPSGSGFINHCQDGWDSFREATTIFYRWQFLEIFISLYNKPLEQTDGKFLFVWLLIHSRLKVLTHFGNRRQCLCSLDRQSADQSLSRCQDEDSTAAHEPRRPPISLLAAVHCGHNNIIMRPAGWMRFSARAAGCPGRTQNFFQIFL